MLRLTDNQLRLVTTAAQPLDPSKRVLLLERVAARLQFTTGGKRPNDADLAKILDQCIRGLVIESAA